VDERGLFVNLLLLSCFVIVNNYYPSKKKKITNKKGVEVEV